MRKYNFANWDKVSLSLLLLVYAVAHYIQIKASLARFRISVVKETLKKISFSRFDGKKVTLWLDRGTLYCFKSGLYLSLLVRNFDAVRIDSQNSVVRRRRTVGNVAIFLKHDKSGRTVMKTTSWIG